MTEAAPTARRAAEGPLVAEELELIDAYWRAANYLSVGQIYLLDNPLLREPLRPEHVKPRLLGHWGTTPGLNFVYAHLNRVIRAARPRRDLRHRPRARRPGLVANAYLEGTYSEVYPDIGPRRGGHAPAVPPVLVPRRHPQPRRARDARLDPRGRRARLLARRTPTARRSTTRTCVVCCVVGDGEAETGPLAASWHSNKFLNPARDGAVLPILHLNGYKIANPTVLARIPEDELRSLLAGYGYAPRFVEGDDPAAMHQLMAATLDDVLDEIARDPARRARRRRDATRPRWPMIVLRTPKGWTGPKEVDGLPSRAPSAPTRCRSPRPARTTPSTCAQLEAWMRTYRPEELFDDGGRPAAGARRPRPARATRRMSANPHANGGLLLRDLRAAGLPRLRRRRARAGAEHRPRRPACSAAACAT